MPLSDAERAVCDAVEQSQARLVSLASDLIAFDTTAREPGDPARDETALQEYLANRLQAIGAETDLFEPDPAELAGQPLIPPDLDWVGRPQLIATRRGRADGPALVLNGHIDVVSVEPRDAWTSPPLTAEVRDGNLFGRGSCDMKGGIAAMVTAAETLAELGIDLSGDLIVATNTDEESTGAGGATLVARGITGDGAIVPEATGGDLYVACRGTDYARIRVPGRPGHAETAHPHWREGGAVNAIEKATIVIDALRGLRQEWSTRDSFEHSFLSRPDILPTMVSAGEWRVTYPSSCDLTVAMMYLPCQADERGFGANVRKEVETAIARAAAADDWLAENPPQIEWWPDGVMPFELDVDERIVTTAVSVGQDLGRPAKLIGLDSWYDGATLTRFGGIPSIACGPPGLDQEGLTVAHTVDEFVPVDGLVACAKRIAVTAMRFCGTAK